MQKNVQGPSLPAKAQAEGVLHETKETSVPPVPKSSRRDYHVESYHGEGGRTWTCETCGKELKSLGAHINHQLWHRGLTAARRARRIRERNLQTKMLRMQQKAIAKRRAREKKAAEGAASKSAPAKVIPARRSPRIAKKDTKQDKGGKGGKGGKCGKK